MKILIFNKKRKIFSFNSFTRKIRVSSFKEYKKVIDFKMDFAPIVNNCFNFYSWQKRFIIQQYISNSLNLKRGVLSDNCFFCFSDFNFLFLHILEYGTFHFFYLKIELFRFLLLKYIVNSLICFDRKDLTKFDVRFGWKCVKQIYFY